MAESGVWLVSTKRRMSESGGHGYSLQYVHRKYAKHEFKNISTPDQDLIFSTLRICVAEAEAEAEATKFQITQNLKSQKNRPKKSAYICFA